MSDPQDPRPLHTATDHHSPEHDEPLAKTSRRLALRTALSLLVLFGLMVLGGMTIKDSLENVGDWIWDHFGFGGVFLGTMLSDTFGVPIPVDAYLVAAVTANAPSLPVIITACVASLCGGSMAWWLGTRLERMPRLNAMLSPYRLRGEKLFKRWGVAAVAVAAWTPLPFSIACWCAGTFKMSFRTFFLTTLHRVPRIIIYYYAIALGWTVGNFG